MKNVSIGTRLTAGFAVVLALLVVMTVVGVWRLQDIGERTQSMISTDLEQERVAIDWATNIEVNGARTIALIKSTVAADQLYFKQQMDAVSASSSEQQRKFDQLISTPEARQLFDAVLAQRKIYTDRRNAIFKLKASGDDAAALAAWEKELEPAMKEYSKRVNALTTYQRGLINKTADIIEAQYRSGRIVLVVLGIIAILVGVVVSWRLSAGITQPLRRAVEVTSLVAAGNLATQVVVDRKDEIGQLMAGLRGMTENLLRTVREVKSGAETISTASTEIAAGNLDLSSRTEQQAGSLEETASALEQLTSTVQNNAENARTANQLALSASTEAINGGAVVGQVVDTMRAINDSSNRIVDIISVIDGIAFQTNILALNAAVEAARAGEQGRGFAVVASEVRSLAQRSATAAREIKTLIDDSVDKVGSGSKLVEQAGATMSDIVNSIKQVSDIVAEITAATQEQSAGISEVNLAIAQMDKVTQQNAALVEQAAAAADALQHQAGQLNTVVGVFNVEETGARVQPAKSAVIADQVLLAR